MKHWKKLLSAFIVTLVFSLPAYAAREKDKKCMNECHAKKDGYYNPAGHWGTLRPLFINYTTFLQSKHGVFFCVECHTDADAGEKTHFAKISTARCERCHIEKRQYSEETKKLFAAGQIKMDDKKRVYADYRESVHGKAFYQKKKNAPYCTGCHNPHNANAKDKDYAAGRPNLEKTCGACHYNETIAGRGTLDRMALFRINGHKKGNPNIDYTYYNCIDCHQGDAVHGKKVNNTNCMMCHKKMENALFDHFHAKKVSAAATLINFFLLYGTLLCGCVIAAFCVGRKCCKKQKDRS